MTNKANPDANTFNEIKNNILSPKNNENPKMLKATIKTKQMNMLIL